MDRHHELKSAADLKKVLADAHRALQLFGWMRVTGASEQIHFAQLINPHTAAAGAAGAELKHARVCVLQWKVSYIRGPVLI